MNKKMPCQVLTTPDRASDPLKTNKKATAGLYHILLLAGKEENLMTLMTRKEAAARLGISVDLLDQERSAGRLAYIQRKPGCKVWITDEAIAEYLARATRQARQTVMCGASPSRKTLSHWRARASSRRRPE